MMENKKLIAASIAGILVVAVIVAVGVTRFKKENKPAGVSEAMKFKESYESLNNTKRSDGATYNNVSIDENNPIKYVSAKEALEILKKDEGAIMYVGANWCPWCRNAVPVLFEVAKRKSVNTIYYLELDDEKSLFEVKDGELIKTREGTEDYYKLLDFLKDNLRDYTLTKDGKTYDTKEKRIYMPFVIASKNGKVVDSITGTITLDKDQNSLSPLTEKQHDELYNKYKALFDKISDNASCDEDCN